MTNLLTKSLLITLTTALLTSCAFTESESQTTKRLTILHTNDNHGRFWHNENGEYGMAARKTLIDQLRQQATDKGHQVLLLSGGDINTGIPESDLQFAEPDFKGMSKIGYDAMAIGNHEFDNPLSVLDKQISWSNFPLLSANIFDKQTGKQPYQGYQMFNKGDLNIAVIGLTTPDTVKIGNPEYIGQLEFREPAQVTQPLIKQLQTQHTPDIVIAVTHMGHYVDGNHSINAPGDVKLARDLPKGMLDVIIGGHSQEPVCMAETNVADKNFAPGKSCKPDYQNGTWIMQAHEWGKYVGKAEFEITGDNITLTSYQLIPVNLRDNTGKQFVGQEIEKDSELLAFLKPFQEKGQRQIAGALGKINARLEGDRNIVRFQQTNLGQLITRAQAQRFNADIAIISSGGIRNSINAGEVSYKDVLSVHPFKNKLTYVDMTGEELIAYLTVVAAFPVDSGAYPQFYGVAFKDNNGKINNLTIHGKKIDPSKKYRLSINSYNAAGGDGYPVLKNHPNFVQSDDTDAEVLKQFIIKHSPIDVSQYQPE